MPKRVLLAGESWIMHTIHQKGYDSFATTAYGEGHQWLSAALTEGGFDVEHLPNHLATDRFPLSPDDLAAYDVVILSDIGANTLLLHTDTFVRSISLPNRLVSLREWTARGGGLVMVGGYLTFQGFEGKANYAGTAIEEALPVSISRTDDRVEAPEGVAPRVVTPSHPIVAGIDESWPNILGYNRLEPKPNADVIATVGTDPLLTAWEFGAGRAVAFASDCGPHWLPPTFLDWPGYNPLWQKLVAWACGE